MKKSSPQTKHHLARPSFVSKQGMVEEAPSKAPPDFAELVYALVRQIPESRVCTYGQIAEWTGYPKHARLVGAVLKVPTPVFPKKRSSLMIEMPGRRAMAQGHQCQGRHQSKGRRPSCQRETGRAATTRECERGGGRFGEESRPAAVPVVSMNGILSRHVTPYHDCWA